MNLEDDGQLGLPPEPVNVFPSNPSVQVVIDEEFQTRSTSLASTLKFIVLALCVVGKGHSSREAEPIPHIPLPCSQDGGINCDHQGKVVGPLE